MLFSFGLVTMLFTLTTLKDRRRAFGAAKNRMLENRMFYAVHGMCVHEMVFSMDPVSISFILLSTVYSRMADEFPRLFVCLPRWILV